MDELDIERTVVPPSAEGQDRGVLRAGESLGQYRITRFLGRGGMGEVYEGEHTTLGRSYAIKILPQEFAASEESLERFRREARVMANLEHPNIVRVDDFGETNGRYWLRMELVTGVPPAGTAGEMAAVSLDQYAAALGGRIPQVDLFLILEQILQGLAYAHAHGAVHRDLKPSNILLAPAGAHAPAVTGGTAKTWASHGVAKIADFGLVRLIGEEWIRSMTEISVKQSMSIGDQQTVAGDVEGTQTRAILGTYAYMSPEQQRGEDADGRSDLYSLGLMLYRLLTGRELSMKLPSSIDGQLTPAWDDVVLRALEQDKNARYRDAGAMVASLAPLRQALHVTLREAPGGGGRRTVPNVQTELALPSDLAPEATAAPPATFDGLALGSREAQVRQAEAAAAAGLPVACVCEAAPITLRLIPPGTFVMGSPEYEDMRDETETQHDVTLTRPFYISTVPVTEATWCRVMGTASALPGADPEAPAGRLSWFDANAFCEKLCELTAAGPGAYRLPTEAEWEYACRAGTETLFYSGATLDDLSRVGWHAQNSMGRTQPVGRKQANAWGLHDMHGNTFEWCSDIHARFSRRAQADPVGPVSGLARVRRGGSAGSYVRHLRSAARAASTPDCRMDGVGLRVVRSVV